jgi:hypothetical protein
MVQVSVGVGRLAERVKSEDPVSARVSMACSIWPERFQRFCTCSSPSATLALKVDGVCSRSGPTADVQAMRSYEL